MSLSATITVERSKTPHGGHAGAIVGRFEFSGTYVPGALKISDFPFNHLRFRDFSEIFFGPASNGYRAQVMDSIPITAATNANPVEITSKDANHDLLDGMEVTIAGMTTLTSANGTWRITKTAANKFTVPVAGNGVHDADTGTITPTKNENWLGYLRLYASALTEATSTQVASVPFFFPIIPVE